MGKVKPVRPASPIDVGSSPGALLLIQLPNSVGKQQMAQVLVPCTQETQISSWFWPDPILAIVAIQE